MKAIAISALGGVDVLQAINVPVPSPAPNEVLIQVYAVSINPVETKIRNGTWASGKVAVSKPPNTSLACYLISLPSARHHKWLRLRRPHLFPRLCRAPLRIFRWRRCLRTRFYGAYALQRRVRHGRLACACTEAGARRLGGCCGLTACRPDGMGDAHGTVGGQEGQWGIAGSQW